jgi:sigma-E factor negative regulatory protein RseB
MIPYCVDFFKFLFIKMVKLFFLVKCFILFLSPGVFAFEENRKVVESIISAGHYLPIVGEYSRSIGEYQEHIQILRSERDADGNITAMRRQLVHTPFEVFRYGNKLSFHANSEEALKAAKTVAFRAFPTIFQRYPDLILRSYQIQKLSSDSIVGFPCTWYAFIPKDGLRYNMRLCIEDRYGLALRGIITNKYNLTVESFSFDRLTINPKNIMNNLSVWQPKLPMQVMTSLKENGSKGEVSSQIKLHVDGIPDGFKMISSAIRTPDHHTPMYQFVYRDGISEFSLFVEKKSGSLRDIASDSVVLQPQINLGMSSLTRYHGDMRLTLVGNLPDYGLSAIMDRLKVK